MIDVRGLGVQAGENWLFAFLAWPVWLAIPLAIVAALRTATRPPMNYAVSGGAAGFQALRGVDLLIAGSVLLSVIA
jgi:hypothetical protein